MLLDSRSSKHGFFTNGPTRIHCRAEQGQRSLAGSCDSTGSGNESKQERHEEAHGTVWIVLQCRLLRCALEHLRESLALDRDKREHGESSDVHGHRPGCVVLTWIFEANPILQMGHLDGKIFGNLTCSAWNEFIRCEARDEAHHCERSTNGGDHVCCARQERTKALRNHW